MFIKTQKYSKCRYMGSFDVFISVLIQFCQKYSNIVEGQISTPNLRLTLFNQFTQQLLSLITRYLIMENLTGWKRKLCIPAAQQLYNANSKNLECYKNNIAMKKLNISDVN